VGVSHWAATLAVGVDAGERLLTPLVRVQGPSYFAEGTLRVELVDQRGAVRRVARCPLLAGSLGGELRMPSFTVPDGANAEDVMRWPWGIVVECDGWEVIRWRRYLSGTASLNAEAEIEFASSQDPRRAKEEAEGKGPEAPWDERDSERLLAVLIHDGELTERDRDTILTDRASTGKTLERALIERGWVDEHELLALYAELTGSEFVDLTECSIDPAAASLIAEEIALRYGLIAIGFRDDDLLTVAMSDPQHPRAVLDIEAATWRRVYIAVATRDDVLTALELSLGRTLLPAEHSA
jgi:hypothetical protein